MAFKIVVAHYCLIGV